jgi:hypothetical protein
MKLPKGLYWWEKKNPVNVYYRALDADGKMLIEDRNPHEAVGRTLKDNVDHYERIECYQVTPGWKPWKPSKKFLEDPDTTMWTEINDEDEDEIKE